MMQPQLRAVPGSRRVRWLGGGTAQVTPRFTPRNPEARRSAPPIDAPRSMKGSHRGYCRSEIPWGAQLILGPVLTCAAAVVAIVLLLACANVASLLLVERWRAAAK